MTVNRNEFLDFLENYLMEEEAKELEITDDEEDGPLIDSMQKANYFLKLVSKIKEDIETMNALCNEEIEKTIDKVNKYREAQTKPLATQVAYYENLLKNYVEKELEGSKKRSVKLPYGTLSMKKQQPKWEYGDEKELIKWFKENGHEDLLTKKETISLDKKTIKEIVKLEDHGVSINGTVVPGVEMHEQEDKFFIKI